MAAVKFQDAEDDQLGGELKKSESDDSEGLVRAMKVNVIEPSNSPPSLYIEMDEIESELNQSDPLPFMNLQGKKQKLEVSDVLLLQKHVIIICLSTLAILFSLFFESLTMGDLCEEGH